MKFIIEIKHFILLIFFLFQTSVISQYAQPRFEHYSVNDGLSSNQISSIIQDSKGFLWVGTKRGLNKYEGYTFKQFNYIPDEINSLTDNEVNFVFQDSKGLIWIATQDGLNSFNSVTEKINRFSLNDSLLSNEVTTVGEDKFGNLWIGTRKGVCRYDQKKNKLQTFTSNASDKNSLSSNIVKAIRLDQNGNLWIGTIKGLCRFDYNSDNFETFLNDSSNSKSLSGNMINCIVEDRKGNLWVGTTNGLSKLIYLKDRIEFENYFFDDGSESGKKLNRIRSIDDDSKGNLWIGTIGGGLIQFEPSTGKFSNYQYSLNDLSSISDNEIFSVCVDNFDNVWIGSPQKGLSKFSPSKARFELFKPENFSIKDVPANDITAIFIDELNQVWLGTKGNGIFVYQLNQNFYPTVLLFNLRKDENGWLGSNYITSILKDKEGVIWIGTLAGGINKFDPRTKKIEIFKTNPDDPNSISNNYINTIFEDSEGYIWIGTSAGGVNRFDKQTKTFKRFVYNPRGSNNSSVNSPEITCIAEDKNGNLWFGTTTGGINLYNRKENRFTYFTTELNNKNSISNRNISGILSDTKNRIWIGTLGGGLNLFEKNSFKHFTEKDGLISNIILSISDDENGNLWLATSKGVSRFNPDTKEIRNYDEGDGLQSSEFNPRAIAKHSFSGVLFFGGVRGLNIYNRKSIAENKTIPQVIITDFKLFNKSVFPGNDSPIKESISFAKEINLSYDQDVISFSFASLDFTSPSKNQYAYMLEGFDRDWIYSGNIREVTYTNLNSGDYIFKVKATNSDGIWNETGTQIKLTIHPPIWRTWWATLIYVIIFAAGIFAIRKYEMNRIKLRNDLRVKEVESKKLQEVDQLKSRFFANLSHEFRTPLMLIKGPVEQLRENSDDDEAKSKLNMVSRNINNLQTLIDQLLELSQLEAAAIPINAARQNLVSTLKGLVSSFIPLANLREILLTFESDLTELDAWVDSDKLEKVINNLLSNALKFTPPKGRIVISLSAEKLDNKEFAQIKISDTGIGIANDKLDKIFERFFQVDDSTDKKFSGSGIGLALVKELVELHKWKISVKSELHKGTEFKVQIPLWNYLEESQKIKVKEVTSETKTDVQVDQKEIDIRKVMPEKEVTAKSDKKPSILIVEDSEDVRIYLTDILKRDYEVIEAENGVMGLESAAQNSPDLIISDIMMPLMDGIEFCKRIKTNWETSHIPVILLTAKVSQESKLEGLETGADDYLIKPFESRELFIRIKNLLDQRRKLREKFSKEIRISAEAVTTNSVDNEFLTKAFEIAEINISNPDFNAEDLVIKLNMSLSKFRRKLLALTGESPGEFLRNYRMKKAAQLILEKKFNITQIAFEVGFNSSSHFTKAFQQQFGCSPSEFNSKLS
ncbi:MAG: two-component regulator propeller domain-containing protein [Ignavibacterium sp.]